jgi:hypothetical protein
MFRAHSPHPALPPRSLWSPPLHNNIPPLSRYLRLTAARLHLNLQALIPHPITLGPSSPALLPGPNLHSRSVSPVQSLKVLDEGRRRYVISMLIDGPLLFRSSLSRFFCCIVYIIPSDVEMSLARTNVTCTRCFSSVFQRPTYRSQA